MTKRFILADDHRIIREGIRSLLETQPGIEIVGEAQNGDEVIKLAKELKPDFIVMDIAMPGISGIEATKKIIAAEPEVNIVALSVYSNKWLVKQMLLAGAKGYLEKSCAFDDLLSAIKTIEAEHIFLSPGITDMIINDQILQMKKSNEKNLTARESEVLQLISEGKTIKEIAEKLSLSSKTVETYKQRIMEKLELFTTAELARYAVDNGLVSPNIKPF